MKKSYLLAGALAMLAIAPAAQAAPQQWPVHQAISGGPGSTTVNLPWSIVSRSGPNCNGGPTTSLNTEFNNGIPTVGGKGSTNSDATPYVTRKFLGPENTPHIAGTMLRILINNILMHPASGPQCAILRFTIPTPSSGPMLRPYRINAHFAGALGNPNSSPPYSTNYAGGPPSASLGVRGMILINGVPYGTVVDTANGGGHASTGTGAPIMLFPGTTIDFAVHNKGEYSFDVTTLDGYVRRVN